MHVKFLETLDWSILIAYFLILIAIGIWASSKRKKGSSLFLAENSLKWYHIGFSMWGTNVGPSMLIASASAGFTTGIVSGNYAWYAFVFICLLAFVFAPRYLGSRITTLPEFMGKRFGQSTRNILAWYTIITILISWLALTLFAGGVLIRQVFDIPMWQSALLLLVISAFFTMLGGLKAVAYTNVYQMILLIVVSATLAIMGIYKVGGNYAASLKANKMAHDLGYSCEFYLDAKEKKYIDECGAANFFGIKNNTYVTPKSTSILPSITNKSLMQLAEDMGMTVERRQIPEEELATFEEAGACGTAAVISPIERIDDLENKKSYIISKDGKPGPVCTQLYHHLRNIQYGIEPDVHGWTTVVME